MGICPYCGKSAGLFTKYHPDCLRTVEEDRNLGIQRFKDQIAAALENLEPYPHVLDKLNEIAAQHMLTSQIAGQAVLSSMDELSRREPLEPQMAEYLLRLGEDFVGKFENIEPDSPFYPLCGPAFLSPDLSRTLWLVMHHQPVPFSMPCPVVLQTGESPLAQFGTVLYHRTLMVSSHAGAYSGPSIRVASGLYYRFGAYGGRSMPTPSQDVSSGFLILTDAAFYFGGEQRTFRVPYGFILRFSAYPDGLGFFRNAGDGREEVFTIVDPWRTLAGC